MHAELFTAELEGIGREMVRKCGRLPLPISVIGGILRQEQTLSEWDKVCKNIDSYLQRGKGVEENKDVKQVLNLSYNVLPYNLKPCFLYLGCFLEDKEIDTKELYLLWMAEGMISSEDRGREETLRDVAERYLCELANRCMVQVKMDEFSISSRFKSCRLHDLMRELCLSKGNEEKFLKVVDTDQKGRHNASSVSRLAIHLDNAEDYLFECQNLQSLLIFKDDYWSFRDAKNLLSINFGKFKSIKILRLEGYRFQDRQFPKGIEKLILLKYFSLENSEVDELPTSICKLPCLQFLNLETFSGIRLPNSIHKMRSLKHLFLQQHHARSFMGGEKLKFDGLNELEIMRGFNSSIDDAADIIKLPKLQVFTGYFYDEDSLSTIVNHISSHQDQFRETNLIVWCNMNSEVDSSTLLKKTLMCHSLCSLDIRCWRVNKLPSYEPQMCRNLMELMLADSLIEEDPMEMLEKLPMLQFLILGSDAFVGREMVCRANGFPQLKYLHLWDLPNLVKWRVEEKAMPNLSSLTIVDFRAWTVILEGLKYITTLKELRTLDMPEEFTDRLRVLNDQVGEDYEIIKHIPSVVIL